uniref:Uncharacterized protein n=1 Tax=Salmonella sp. 40 TaxID=1179813 RepID=I3W3L1_9ENTR|nr:hypothetical protein [Salmonella sp. 40]
MGSDLVVYDTRNNILLTGGWIPQGANPHDKTAFNTADACKYYGGNLTH